MRLLYLSCLLILTFCYYSTRISAALTSSQVEAEVEAEAEVEVSVDSTTVSTRPHVDNTFDLITSAVNDVEGETTRLLSEEEHQQHVQAHKSFLQMRKKGDNKKKKKAAPQKKNTPKKPKGVSKALAKLKAKKAAKKEAKKKKKAAENELFTKGIGRGGKCLKNRDFFSTQKFDKYSHISKYSEEVAYQLKRFSDISYCPYKKIKAWDCDNCKTESQAGFKLLGQPFGAKSELSAYVGLAPIADEKKAIVIAFRGTVFNSIKNWATNLSFAKKSASKIGAKGKVHGGFMKGYNQMEADVLKALKLAKADCKRCKIYITGHSLGGALATIAAAKLIGNGHISPKRTVVYHFGSPRVGDKTFARWFEKNIPNSWRVTHGYDIVPTVPPSGFGFQHIQREVYYPHVSRDFYICNNGGEDKQCHRQNGKLRKLIKGAKYLVKDHLLYVGSPITCDAPSASFLEMHHGVDPVAHEIEEAALQLYRALGGTLED